jgi:hypothetical protein
MSLCDLLKTLKDKEEGTKMTGVWENLNGIKEQVLLYADTAKNNNWISVEEHEAISRRIQSDVLTIGVIGQMKAGKSTFLNALLFRDNVLPVASTPMTAALSVITYGEKEEVLAEFYAHDEWEEIKAKALMEGDTADIKAAQELTAKAQGLGNLLDDLLGKTQSASMEDMIDFVGADGKYVSITKSVTIKCPNEKLKGVEIVDTPGFNDPVVSREERTREFLAKADMVILLLYAERAFDETDKIILLEKVKNVGVGKIIIGVNKYDLQLENGKFEDEIRQYVCNAITKAVREKNDTVLNQLLGQPDPVLFSAQFALLGSMPLSKISADADLKWHYDDTVKKFGLSSQPDIFKMSKITDLEARINILLEKEKLEILVRKPINEIQARIDAKKTDFELKNSALSTEKKNLTLDDTEWEDRLKTFRRAEKKVRRTIDSKEIDLNEFVDTRIKDTIYKLKMKRNEHIDNFHRIIDDTKKMDDIPRKIESRLNNFKGDMEKIYMGLYRDVKYEFKGRSDEIILDLHEIIAAFSDEDDKNSEDLINVCKKELEKFNNLSFEEMFSSDNLKRKKKGLAGNIIGTALITVGFGAIGLGAKAIYSIYKSFKDKKEFIRKCHDEVDKLMLIDQIEETFEPVRQQAKTFIAFFRTRFLDELLTPVIGKIEEMEQVGFDKEKRLKEIESELKELSEEKKKLDAQLVEVNNYIKLLPMRV